MTESAVTTTTEQKLGEYTEDRKRWCRLARESGLVPKSLNSDAKVFIAIEAGMECGFSPLQALKSVYVVNGMPSLTGKATMALILQANVCKIPPTAEWGGEGDGYGCTITLQRNEHPHPVKVSFTVADAKRAGLWGKSGPWKDHPDQMLQWRAVSRMADFYFADLTAGLSVMEVVRDRASVEVERAKPAEIDPLLVGSGNIAESNAEQSERMAALPDDHGGSVDDAETIELDPETGEPIPDYILQGE